MKNQKILIIGSYGRGNIGDDAFLVVLYKFFKDKYQIIINSAGDSRLPSEVEDKVQTLDTNFFSKPLVKIKTLFQIKAIVYGGGNLWLSLIGEKLPNRNLWKMVFVNFIAKVLGKKIYYLGCGVAELDSRSLRIAKLSANLADFIVFRDKDSSQRLGLKKYKYKVLPDLTTNLLPEKLQSKENKNKIKKVIISILYHVPDPEFNFPKLVDSLARIINKNQDKQFILLPMMISNNLDQDDLWACKQLSKKLEKSNYEIFDGSSLEDYLQVLKEADLTVGTRLHSNILSFISGTPSIGIAYREKVQAFFDSNNLSNYCINMDNLDNLDKIWENIQDEITIYNQKLTTIRKNMLKKVKEFIEIVDKI